LTHAHSIRSPLHHHRFVFRANTSIHDAHTRAGVQADLKTIEACGGFGTSAVTSVTAQNTTGVHGSHLLPTGDIAAQIEAVLDDFGVGAVKTGMLATTPVIETVLEYTDRLPNLVVDPVMVAASGDRLLEPDAEDAYESLVAEAALVTPNADEAAVLTGVTVEDRETAREAGEALVETGAAAALVKGGHVPGETVVDTLVTPEGTHAITHPRVDTDATHGSGCALSSAVATHLAHGEDLRTAVTAGIDLLGRAVRYNVDVGHGPGAVHHLVALRDRAARQETVAAVESVLDSLAFRSLSGLVAGESLAIAAATPYAADGMDVATGRLSLSATPPVDRVSLGDGGPLAASLSAVRERRPDLTAACRFRLTAAARDAIDARDWVRASLDADDRALDADGSRPLVVADRPETVLVAADTDALIGHVEALLEA
jgi:hydroxymethylpyrimidine/phosphomethylpyrimidine kinase